MQVNGLTLRNLNDETRQRFAIEDDVKGALVEDIDPESAAYESGIRPGDVITEVDQQAVTNAEGVATRLKAAKEDGKNSVLIFIVSDGVKRFIAMPLND